MDYQEAIELLKKANRSNDMVGILPKSDISKAIISAIQELQEYKQLGTLEEMKLFKATHLTGVELAGLYCALKKLNEYEKLGTMEEVREAVEKQKRKKPCASNRCYVCPHCGLVTSLKIKHNYCDACDQHIDWSEEE